MSGARERIRRVTGSLYWRQFMLTAGMVLLTLALLGVSFYALSYNYTLSEKRQEMRDRAVLVAQLSVDYFTAGEDAERDQEDALRSLAGVASRMTDVDFLICDTDGNVMLTTDGDLAGQTITVPADITGAVLGGDRLYEGRSTVGVYEKRQFVVGVPMTDAEGNTLGLVLAVMNSAELTQMWRSFIALFFMSSAIILVLAFITSFVTAMRQIQPLSEMVKATRAYAAGDFDVRMQETGDCSEISELAASFNAMADSLQETERQRRDFIANVSHELKTPMTTIAGFAEGILDGTIPPEREKESLQIIVSETRRLSRLVRRMLDLSRLNALAESTLTAQEQFDLTEVVSQVLISLEGKITGRNLDVDVQMPEEKLMVWGDPDSITQVCYNLLDNAAKFAASGTTLTVQITKKDGKAYTTIRNLGATIPQEELPLLFDRFHKADYSRSMDREGVGLGLYIVKTILNNLKENITVTSEDGVTQFTFTLTLA